MELESGKSGKSKAWQRLKNLKGGKRFGRCRHLAPRLATATTSQVGNKGPRARFLESCLGKRRAEEVECPPKDLAELIARKSRMLSDIRTFSREQVKLQMEHIKATQSRDEVIAATILKGRAAHVCGIPNGIDRIDHSRDRIQLARGKRLTAHAACHKGIGEMHAHLEQEYWRRVEENAKARATHLRASDFNAYLDEVEKQGDQHVDKLLEDSNSCLLKILTRLSASREGLVSTGKDGQGTSIRDTSAGWAALAEKIPAVLSQLPDLKIELHPHQLDGLSWLVGLHDISFNGILADEMGLGKTVQTIALVAYLVQVRKVQGLFLIVAPASVLPHWINEFKTFSPDVVVHAYQGNFEERSAVWNDKVSLSTCMTPRHAATACRHSTPQQGTTTAQAGS
eukprot:jgi/Ulvmu1/7507/UM037_0051.1